MFINEFFDFERWIKMLKIQALSWRWAYQNVEASMSLYQKIVIIFNSDGKVIDEDLFSWDIKQ